MGVYKYHERQMASQAALPSQKSGGLTTTHTNDIPSIPSMKKNQKNPIETGCGET